MKAIQIVICEDCGSEWDLYDRDNKDKCDRCSSENYVSKTGDKE